MRERKIIMAIRRTEREGRERGEITEVFRSRAKLRLSRAPEKEL